MARTPRTQLGRRSTACATRIVSWTRRPLVSIVMPTYNPQEDWLRPAIESVLGQVYENWELCIADDASTAPHVDQVLDQFTRADPRIKVVRRPENGGIAAASASALELATGEFIALLDHDDLLRPHALHRMVELLQIGPRARRRVLGRGHASRATASTASPSSSRTGRRTCCCRSTTSATFLVLRRDLVEQTGGFRPGFDGAQDHDLVLRATERARHIGHVPDVLYAWRQVPGSVALAGDAKMYAYEAGQRAVEEALARRGLSGPGDAAARTSAGTTSASTSWTTPRWRSSSPPATGSSSCATCIESIESQVDVPELVDHHRRQRQRRPGDARLPAIHAASAWCASPATSTTRGSSTSVAATSTRRTC